jgi:hypothetical protein
MQYFAANDEFVQNTEQTFGDAQEQPFEYGTFGKIAADITPLRFGRRITSVTTTVTITRQPGDSIAIAYVVKDITGQLRIRALDGNGDTILVNKPFQDRATRNVIFKRIDRNPRRYWLNWVPVATSLVEGGTLGVTPPDSISLAQLDFFLPNGDTITVTDPNSYYLRYRWLHRYMGGRKDVPELAGGDSVMLRATLVSSSPDTDLVALRYGFGPLHSRRVRMMLVSETNNGNGTYTRVYERSWRVHFHPGFFHAGVDCLTRDTLFDDVAPYSVSWWGVPYRVF